MCPLWKYWSKAWSRRHTSAYPILWWASPIVKSNEIDLTSVCISGNLKRLWTQCPAWTDTQKVLTSTFRWANFCGLEDWMSEWVTGASHLPLLVVKGDRQSLFCKNAFTASDVTGRRYSYCSLNIFSAHYPTEARSSAPGWFWMLKGFKVKSYI